MVLKIYNGILIFSFLSATDIQGKSDKFMSKLTIHITQKHLDHLS